MRVSSAEFIRNYGTLSDKALNEPVRITRNGRERLVLISSDEYDRLLRRDRRVVLAENLTEEELDAISRAEVPEEYHHLDELLNEQP